MTEDGLIRIAKEAWKKAYAPYSGLKVGAALETADGEVFRGVNVENSSYGLSCCAERSAVFAAVCAGKRDFKRIAIAGSAETALRPCGACLQVMWEFAPDMDLLLVPPKGPVERHRVRDLLPEGFVFENGRGE